LDKTKLLQITFFPLAFDIGLISHSLNLDIAIVYALGSVKWIIVLWRCSLKLLVC